MVRTKTQDAPQSILPIRFTVKEANLCSIGAHILTIDWMKYAQSVLEKLITQNKPANGRIYLPTVSLDMAMSALNPVVAHGFRDLDRYKGTHFTSSVNEQPDPRLIAHVSSTWADSWANYYFPGLVSHRDYRDLRARIERPSVWQEINAHAALYDPEKEKLRYSIIPSILSVLFVTNGASTLGGQTIEWGLAQQAGNNGWQIVSNPIQARNGASYAYLIRFTVQYQPGVTEPRIHTAIVCQRYADRPISDENQRRVSMLCRLGRPLMAQGSWNQNQIRLVASRYGDNPWAFGRGLPEILRNSQARTLEDPNEILSNPQRFRGTSQGDDRYLVVHYEGLETEREPVENESEDENPKKTTNGAHGTGTGFSLSERREIYQTILDRLGDLLTPSAALPKVETGRVLRSTSAWNRQSEGKNADSKRYLESFQRANRGAASILLLYRTTGMGEMMEFFVRRLFHMRSDEAWPEWLQVRCERIDDELGRILEVPEKGKASGTRRADAEREMSNRWAAFLEPRKTERQYAWIELPPSNSFTSPHDAIRDACIRIGVASQMIAPLPKKLTPDVLMNMKKNHNSKLANKTFGRMFNAVADLLLRSSGTIMRDELARDAAVSGFPKEIANQLSVIGLTVFQTRTNYRIGRGEVVLPLAVRMSVDGVMQTFWEQEWRDYYTATMQIGRLFADTERRARVWDEAPKQRDQRINDYVRDMLLTIRDEHAVLIVDAVKIRRYIKGLRVGDLQKGSLDVSGMLFDTFSHPNLKMVWARFDTPAENIQYVAQGDEGPMGKVADQSLFVDIEAEGRFSHYFSLGRQMPNSEKMEDGYRYELEKPKTNYRYQQAIELVPFFGQEAHLRPSIILTHGLRSGPHFTLTSLTRPYPIHLATKMLLDLVCLLGVKPDEVEEP